MSPNWGRFTDFRSIEPKAVKAADKTIFLATGVGHMKIDIPNGKEDTSVVRGTIQIHSDPLHTHSGPFHSQIHFILIWVHSIRIHSNSFGSTLILVLSSFLSFTTQSGTVLCSPIHSLILLFDHLCHSAFRRAGSCACSIYSLSYWAKRFLGVFSLDPPSPGMSEWCT